MDAAGHSLVLAFDTDDAEFARGVEVGRLWEALKSDPNTAVVEIVHGSNAEMALRIAEATNRHVSSVDLDATWIEVSFTPELGTA